MVKDDVQLMDFHGPTGSSASLIVNPNGGQFLTVNTSNAQTSWTLTVRNWPPLGSTINEAEAPVGT